MTPGLEKQLHAGEILAPAQKLLVQIVKEPIGSKGPRVSTDITLAGRFLVLVPLGDYIGVSKRIRSYKERRRLRNIISHNLPEGFGVIVRTVADSQTDEVIKRDLQEQLNKWEEILSKIKVATPPALLYRDLDMTESLIRDLFAKDYNRLLIDDTKMYRSIKNYVADMAPQMLPHIELYKGSEHVFDYMKIAQDVESIFSPRVKMPSGGYLIFEQTEAMYVIDVNSGRYAAKKHQEDNSLRTNLEASREIAKQLRLRDIGGIIVVDFIDLRDDTNRKKVYDELKKEFKKDRAKTNILPMSDFGLVQITRQRIRPSVVNSVSRICPMCGGSGSVVSQNTIVSDIEAWLTKFKHTSHYKSIDLYINPYLKSFLTRGMFSQQIKWMFRYHKKISMIADETISLNDYKFTLSGSEVDITEAVLLDQPLEEAIRHSQEIAPVEGLKGGSDKTNLDVYDNPKKNKNGGRNVKHVAKTTTHEHSHEEKTSKRDYYQEKRNNVKSEKETKTTDKSATKAEAKKQSTTSRSGRSNKISKYYKSDSESDKTDKQSNNRAPETAKYQLEKEKEKKSGGQDSHDHNNGDKEEPRSAIEVAREYRLQQMKEAEKEAVQNSDTKVETQANNDVVSPKNQEPSEVTDQNKETAAVASDTKNDEVPKKAVTKPKKKATLKKTAPTKTKKKTPEEASEKITGEQASESAKTKKATAAKSKAKAKGRPVKKTAAKKISKSDTETPKKVTRTRKTTKKGTQTPQKGEVSKDKNINGTTPSSKKETKQVNEEKK